MSHFTRSARFSSGLLCFLLVGLTACSAGLARNSLDRTEAEGDYNASLLSGNGTPESVGFSSEGLVRLDRVLEGFVDRGQIPGYQLAVARFGEVVHESVYGQREIESGQPLTPDTIYRIYSMSKVITGVATLVAYERGHFLLGDPVSKYLPALGEMQVLERDQEGHSRTVPADREITILDLLRHTSGITYSFMAPPELAKQYLAEGLTPGLRGASGGDTVIGALGKEDDATLEDMVERLGKLPLIAHPGTAWHYGINMDVLGRLIEVQTGQAFPEFLEEHVFRPLGMRDTAFFVPPEKLDRFAASYQATPDGGLRLADAPATSEYRTPPAMPGGGGGLVSTTADYMRFALMLANQGELDGVRLLGPKTVEMMMSNQLAPADFGPRPLKAATGQVFANGSLGVGFGLTGSVVTKPAYTGLPISKGTFGWGGAASTYFWVDPKEEVAVVFMTQLLMSNTYPLRAHLLKGVNAALLD